MGNADGKTLKTFVIDTNVFIHKHDAILSFRDNEIVIPLWVLEELDSLKSFSDERGRNARHAVRMLDEFGKRGNLHKGVKLDNGSILRVVLTHTKDVPQDLVKTKADNKILFTALMLQNEGKRVFFVSKDINARVKAAALGIKAVDYEKQKVDVAELYAGYRTMKITPEVMQELKDEKSIPWKSEFASNEFFILETGEENESAIGRYYKESGLLRLISNKTTSVSGIKPLNQQQKMAFNLLLDNSVQLVSLVGIAGTGKTLLAIASALKLVLDENKYSRILSAVYRLSAAWTRPSMPSAVKISSARSGH